MKNLFYIPVLFFLIVSCSVKKKPTFIKVDDVKIVSIDMDTIRLQASAYFKNENDIGGKIATDEIKVLVNGVAIAKVSSKEFKVPARDEFLIPLQVVMPSKRVLENNKEGILGGLLSSVLNNSLKIQFKGDIKYKVLGFSSVYPIDTTKEIKIKL